MAFGFRKVMFAATMSVSLFSGYCAAQEPIYERAADPRIDKQSLSKSEKAADSPYYPLAIGTTWEYSITSPQTPNKVEVCSEIVANHNYVDNQLVGFIEKRMKSPSGEEMTTSNQYIGIVNGDICRFGYLNFKITPPFCIMKAGKKGDTWNVNSTIQTAAELSPQRSTGTFILDEQEVEVPAGKYQCLVVKTKDMMSGRDPIEVSTYYAKGVGPVMQVIDKKETKIVCKLTKFTLGTGALSAADAKASQNKEGKKTEKAPETKDAKPLDAKKPDAAKKN